MRTNALQKQTMYMTHTHMTKPNQMHANTSHCVCNNNCSPGPPYHRRKIGCDLGGVPGHLCTTLPTCVHVCVCVVRRHTNYLVCMTSSQYLTTRALPSKSQPTFLLWYGGPGKQLLLHTQTDRHDDSEQCVMCI